MSVERLILSYSFQVCLGVTIQDKVGVSKRGVEDQVIQLCSLIHVVREHLLNRLAADGDHAPIGMHHLNTSVIHIEFAGNQFFHGEYLHKLNLWKPCKRGFSGSILN